MKEARQLSVTTTTPMTPTPKSSLPRRAARAPMPMPPPKESEEDIPVLTAMSPDVATRIDSSDMGQAEAATEEASPAENADWSEGFSPEEIEKVSQYATQDEIKKALLHAQRKIGQQGTENAGLLKMVADQLTTLQAKTSSVVSPQTPTPVPPIDLDKLKAELAKNWLDTPEENVTKLLDAAQKIAASQVESVVSKRDEAEAVRFVKRLVNKPEWKGLVTPDNAVIIDAMASIAAGETFAERYEHALESYAKEKNWKGMATMATLESQAETEAMRQAAQAATAPNSAAPTQKKKVYNRQWIKNLLITDPDKYRAMQPELMKAYSEGRVK